GPLVLYSDPATAKSHLSFLRPKLSFVNDVVKLPKPCCACKPLIADPFLDIILITPPNALEPYNADTGPQIISIRSVLCRLYAGPATSLLPRILFSTMPSIISNARRFSAPYIPRK